MAVRWTNLNGIGRVAEITKGVLKIHGEVDITQALSVFITDYHPMLLLLASLHIGEGLVSTIGIRDLLKGALQAILRREKMQNSYRI